MAKKLTIEGLYQVALTTTDINRSCEFYRDTLGLKQIAVFDPPGLAFFDLDGVRLSLMQKEEIALKSSKACKDKQGQVRPLVEWNLPDLIGVSVELELIGKTAKQASWALKDFRNFIHPYNVLQQSARPDAALAMSAMAALIEIRRSLEGKLSK